MCGIVGAVALHDIVPTLVQGLQRLEYRGYDSCGVAIHAASLDPTAAGGLVRARSTQRVAELLEQVRTEHLSGGTGIAHTRWATHGAPAVHNAHPHFSHGCMPGAAAQPGRVALAPRPAARPPSHGDTFRCGARLEGHDIVVAKNAATART